MASDSNKPESETYGIEPFPIEGPMRKERYRLAGGMTEPERQWRKQWLKDQILSDNEPRAVPGIYVAKHNPIRRIYRFPMNFLFDKLTPVLGPKIAANGRYTVGKVAMTVAAMYAIFYHFKYNRNDWTKRGGWNLKSGGNRVLPGHPSYPLVSDRTKPSDYFDRGFSKSPI